MFGAENAVCDTETTIDKTASLHITAVQHSQRRQRRRTFLKSQTNCLVSNAKPEPVSPTAVSAELIYVLIPELTSEIFAERFFEI